MSVVPAAIATDLSPTGTLRAAINLGNPVLAGHAGGLRSTVTRTPRAASTFVTVGSAWPAGTTSTADSPPVFLTA